MGHVSEVPTKIYYKLLQREATLAYVLEEEWSIFRTDYPFIITPCELPPNWVVYPHEE